MPRCLRTIVLLACALAACGERRAPTDPTIPAGHARLSLRADVTGTLANALAVEVTAPDLPRALVFNIPVADGVASGSIHIPAGSDRTITVRAFDRQTIETHRGGVTLTVRAGTNATVSVVLYPLVGHQPITVSLGSYVIVVSPAAPTIAVGSTAQLSATITDADDLPVVADVVWATLNPAYATVNDNGLVTAKLPGQVQVVASYAGVAGSTTVTVTAATAPAVVASVTVSSPSGTLAQGATQQLTATLTNAAGSDVTGQRPVAWTSSNTAVATVNAASGLVTAESPGSTTMTATSEGVSGGKSLTITVTWKTLSSGTFHTCALTIRGVGYCWGDNQAGQLGDGSTTTRSQPAPVAGDLRFTSVSVGAHHACALTAENVAYCWGYNGHGRLGDGTMTDRLTPVPVSGGHRFATIVAGGGHTCGVTITGTGYCWGYNEYGQLGDGGTTHRETPVAVSGGARYLSVVAGRYWHTCGITTSGAAQCWGYNAHGRLGDGTTTDRSTPTPVTGDFAFASLTVGGAHTCGVTTAGPSYCWGYNGEGGLGDGTTNDRATPALTLGGHSFRTLSGGGFWSTCGVTTSNVAYCWGYNNNGQLGNGTAVSASTPVPVSGGLAFAGVSAGGEWHTCGVTTAGVAYCWGNNVTGERGDADTGPSLAPMRVREP